ncbi:MAG: hypothetical protein BWK76_06625 [Desulfobulbaceae bacterium A2]|nr:MAG: hypothetical protein BWK76_06625 [Desulfobulbaceae bacterium A2]
MTTSFLDANVFLRYLTSDDPVKADRVERLLASAAAGQARLVTTELVIAEVVNKTHLSRMAAILRKEP